jgi:hypothetical protein
MSRIVSFGMGMGALAAFLAAAPTLALAKHHHVPPLYYAPPGTSPNGPPPALLYPQPQSSAATQRLPHVQSQVPVGRAQPGVTPYEMLPNKP